MLVLRISHSDECIQELPHPLPRVAVCATMPIASRAMINSLVILPRARSIHLPLPDPSLFPSKPPFTLEGGTGYCLRRLDAPGFWLRYARPRSPQSQSPRPSDWARRMHIHT